jgi:hypothetical protein
MTPTARPRLVRRKHNPAVRRALRALFCGFWAKRGNSEANKAAVDDAAIIAD